MTGHEASPWDFSAQKLTDVSIFATGCVARMASDFKLDIDDIEEHRRC
jgi:hypothetical protein